MTMTTTMGRLNEPVLVGEILRMPFEGRTLTTVCPHCGRKLLTLAGVWVQAVEEHPLHEATIGLESVCTCEMAQIAIEEEKRAQSEREEAERKAQKKWKLKARWAESKMPTEWEDRGLKCWVRETEAQEKAYRTAAAFGKAITEGSKPKGLFISGDIGTGKTFLASCLAADLLRRDKAVLWSNASDILRALRASYNNSRVSEEEVIARYVRPGILVLDDLGKERPTEWSVEQLFSIVNARYDKRKPVIVTTNYGGDELVRRLTPRPDADGYADDTTALSIVDRLKAMSNIINLEGRSWR